jgi:hypothetical protein
MKNLYTRYFLFVSLSLLTFLTARATNYTSTGSGNWSSSSTWSPSGVPGSNDNVTVAHGNTVTVNGNYTCKNLTIGDATSGATTVNVSTGYTLTITGACSINPSNLNNTYTLNAGAGTVAVAGTYAMGTSGTNIIEAGTGTLTFTPAVTIAYASQAIKLTAAGTINFKSSFTDNYNKLTPYSGCTVNFSGNYTVSTTDASWSGGTAIFSGSGTITANSNLTLYNLQTAASASTTLASASGNVIITNAVTLSSASTLTAAKSFELDGNWTNNSGTFSGGSTTITFNGTSTISGVTSFPYIQIGNTATSNTVSATLNNNATCAGLTFNGYNKARTLTLSAGDTLAVNGNVLINQPTSAKTNNLAVNGGTCTISGNLSFSGTATTANYISKITVTTGSLLVSGTTSFDNNSVAANQEITVTSTGSATFAKSLIVSSGTLSITGSGAFNFNGNNPSLTFGGSNNPNFTSTNGSSLNFAHGFVNNTNALTLATACNTNFKGNSTITANADITFGNIQFNALDTIASAGSNVIIGGTCTVNAATIVNALQNVDVAGSSMMIASGSVYAQNGGSLKVEGDVIDSGTITAGSSGAINLDGEGANISGSGIMNDSAGTITLTNNKTITAGSALTFGTVTGNTTIDITSGTTVSNGGTIIVNGSITGDDNTATWLNNYEGALSITGELLDIGSLDAATVPNTVTYNGPADQGIATPLSSYYNLVVANGGTKSLSAPVQVDDSVIILNAATLDENTNALTGLATLTMSNDSSGLKLTRNTSGTYPELTGVYSLTGGTVTINLSDNPAIITPAIYYNLVLQGNQPFDISGISTITNNIYLQNTATLSNNDFLEVLNLFIYESTAYTYLFDDISVNGIEILAGTLDDGGNSITIDGGNSWTMSGGNFNATGQTIFYPKSPVPQIIGGTTPANFNDLVINNPAGITLNLNPPAATSVSGFLNLYAGNINTDTSNILLMLSNAAVLNGSANSYVSGPMQKVGNSNFIFPIGKSGIYGQAGFAGATNPATLVTAEYFPASYSTLTPRALNLTQVSDKEYWLIERTVTTDSIQIQLIWTNASASSIINCSDLTIAHYTGGEWINEPATCDAGSLCAGTGNGNIVTVGYVSNFSPFTFGGSGGFALPMTLLSFNATPEKNTVITSWQTGLQINNAFFTLERSAEGINFTPIATIPAAGNSTALIDYAYTDKSPLSGQSYYRLRQTDYNGNSTISNIAAVNLVSVETLAIYPNPAQQQINISLPAFSIPTEINIYDITGRKVFHQTYAPNDSGNNQLIPLNSLGSLPRGTYIVNASTTESSYNEKLILE